MKKFFKKLAGIYRRLPAPGWCVGMSETLPGYILPRQKIKFGSYGHHCYEVEFKIVEFDTRAENFHWGEGESCCAIPVHERNTG
jgi:hypothetical protein